MHSALTFFGGLFVVQGELLLSLCLDGGFEVRLCFGVVGFLGCFLGLLGSGCQCFFQHLISTLFGFIGTSFSFGKLLLYFFKLAVQGIVFAGDICNLGVSVSSSLFRCLRLLYVRRIDNTWHC